MAPFSDEPAGTRRTARGVDLLAVLKGALATLAALFVTARLGLHPAWAFLVGAAVIAFEKGNHTRGRRDRPMVVAACLLGLLALGVVFLLVASGGVP